MNKTIHETRNRELGRFLKDRRESRNVSQGALAKHLGYSSPQYISNWERGLCAPPLDALPVIADVLAIPKTQIIKLILDYTRLELEESFSRTPQKKRQAR